MSGALRWCVITGSILLSAVFMALTDRVRLTSQVAQQATAAELPLGPSGVSSVMARVANGGRHPLNFDSAATSQALVLLLPMEWAGQDVDVTLWRRRDNRRDVEPWICMRPMVRSDATLPMAGIVPGQYDIQVGLPADQILIVEDAQAPGAVSFVVPTPIR